MSYPQGFSNWSEDRRNSYFAKEARKVRERQAGGNGHAKPFEPGPDPPTAFDPRLYAQSNWRMGLACASGIKPEPISWLWEGWLANGKMHIIAGQPGTGKTTIAMKMAAVVSSGGHWPDGTSAKQGNVVIWSGEDDPADTLVPRLEASGANLSRVFFAGEMSCGKECRAFDPAKDIPALQTAIEAAGGAKMVIVDPIVSATAADSHKNSETRRALQPLIDMAAKLDAALLGITHFTKASEGRSPIDRVTGSVAFGALARVVMVAAREQAGADGKPGPRVIMRAKSNIGPDDDGFNYELQTVPMRDHPDILASVVSWGQAVAGSAREILAAAESEPKDNDGEGTAFREAKDWLLDFLLGEPKTAREVQSAGRENGHSWATLRRAKHALRVRSVKNGLVGGWAWTMPSGDDSRRCSNSPYYQNDEHLRSSMSTFEEAQGAQGFVDRGDEHLPESGQIGDEAGSSSEDIADGWKGEF